MHMHANDYLQLFGYESSVNKQPLFFFLSVQVFGLK